MEKLHQNTRLLVSSRFSAYFYRPMALLPFHPEVFFRSLIPRPPHADFSQPCYEEICLGRPWVRGHSSLLCNFMYRNKHVGSAWFYLTIRRTQVVPLLTHSLSPARTISSSGVAPGRRAEVWQFLIKQYKARQGAESESFSSRESCQKLCEEETEYETTISADMGEKICYYQGFSAAQRNDFTLCHILKGIDSQKKSVPLISPLSSLPLLQAGRSPPIPTSPAS